MNVIGLDAAREAHRYLLLDGSTREPLDEGVLSNKSWAFDAWAEEMESFGGGELRLCLECGNGISTPIEQFALARGWQVVTLPPKAVKTYRENVMGQLNKTDQTDAEAIALLGAEKRSATRFATRKQPRGGLRRLSRDRERMGKEKTATKNRLRRAISEICPELNTTVIPDLETQPILWILANHPDPKQWAELGVEKLLALLVAGKVPSRVRRPIYVRGLVEVAERYRQTLPELEAKYLCSEIRMLARRLQRLLEDIKDTEDLLESLIANDEQVQIIKSLPGAGTVLASLIMGEMQDIINFPSEAKLASYAGQALKECQTGKSCNYKRPQINANRRLKRALMQVALSNARLNPLSKVYYNRKIAEGKTPLQALRALARQLVRLIYAMLRKSQPFQGSDQA